MLVELVVEDVSCSQNEVKFSFAVSLCGEIRPTELKLNLDWTSFIDFASKEVPRSADGWMSSWAQAGAAAGFDVL